MWSDPESTAHEAELPAQTYVYPAPLVPGAPKPASSPGNSSTLERLWGSETKGAGPLPASDEQTRAREARARQEGREEAEGKARAEYEKRLATEHEALAQAIREFARERAAYFGRVEAEVVGLALAIARKILHREAQVDPLLLAGVVRVGLDKVAAGTHVRLRVHPEQIQAWQQFFAQQPDLQSVPELMGDAALGLGHCRLETELGSTDLTLEAQLKEIEQGFFDLLAQRPQKAE
jgi:flagellar assembly protein FliH